MQCKDIPYLPILRHLAEAPDKPHTWFNVKCDFNVRDAMPRGTPGKLVLAKMKTLVNRGLVHGCPCGCRGDFTITDAAYAHLQ